MLVASWRTPRLAEPSHAAGDDGSIGPQVRGGQTQHLTANTNTEKCTFYFTIIESNSEGQNFNRLNYTNIAKSSWKESGHYPRHHTNMHHTSYD